MAGAVGFEPTIMEPESIALPLGYAPTERMVRYLSQFFNV